MQIPVILDAVRTPVGSFGGAIKEVSPVDLGRVVIQEVLKRSDIEPGLVDEVLLGNVLQAAQGQNPARQAALKAGIPVEVPAITVNMVCGSGLKTVMLAENQIKTGEAEIVLAGGMESMSQAPYALTGIRWGSKMGDGVTVDIMVKDGLNDALYNYPMGITAENLAEKYGLTRQEQDEFALHSQLKAEVSIKNGRFKNEIVEVLIPRKKGEPVIFNQDEHPRFGSTLDGLAKLRPAFKENGTVTAGNASGINDGAASILIASEEKARKIGKKPIARIISSACAGVDPSIMGIGPVDAIKKALKKSNLSLDQIDLMEINEAFAAQALSVIKELNLDLRKVNVNGGAIALGHPLGASGARILVSLLYEMKKQGARYGLASLCVGGGMGVAVIVEGVKN